MYDSLQLGLMLAESGILDQAVREMMSHPQLVMLSESSPQLKDAIQGQLNRWRDQLQTQLSDVTEDARFEQEIALYQQAVELDSHNFLTEIPALIAQLANQSGFYLQARQLLEHPKHRYNPMFQSYFCNCWFEDLQLRLAQAQQDQLEQHKQRLLEDLYQRIETLQQLSSIYKSGDSAQLGRLWDMAMCKLTTAQFSVLQKTADNLRKQPALQILAQQLGRMAEACVQQHNDAAHDFAPSKKTQVLQNAFSGDINGICESDKLTNMLPSETLFLAYPELEVIFYKHMLERRLLSYQQQSVDVQTSLERAKQAQAAPPKQSMGPFILAIDSSGSMQGMPERAAKAIAYALMEIALAQGRECFVMLFSTEHICYELTRQNGLREAVAFLSYQFHGGTDFNAMLDNAQQKMREGEYQNADLLVLSDFMAPALPDALQQCLLDLKQQDNRLHALSFGAYANPQLLAVFDQHWRYQRGRVLAQPQ